MEDGSWPAVLSILTASRCLNLRLKRCNLRLESAACGYLLTASTKARALKPQQRRRVSHISFNIHTLHTHTVHEHYTTSKRNMTAPDATLPSLLWRRRRNESSNSAENTVELARSPTWPAMLPSPQIIPPVACPQPNLYLQLTQILEWEIWNHNQTRAQFCAAQNRCSDMEAEMWRLSQAASQWEDTCRAAHVALDEHRMERIKLVQEMEATAAELHTLQQQVRLTVIQ